MPAVSIVAPGFIDFHAHGQNIPADRMQAFDGVTTALELESGILPVAAWYDNQETVRQSVELRGFCSMDVRSGLGP